MQTKFSILQKSLIAILFLVAFSCKKNYSSEKGTATTNQKESSLAIASEKQMDDDNNTPSYNLEVNLYGEGNRNGHIHFRQDADPAKIITLDTKIHHLLPNHEYLLQRAVDPINMVDGNCTSTSWLTLGHGLTPQSILTNDKGNGEEELWRDVTAIPSGSTFDIHFRVIDAVSLEVVLTSDCYQYTVR
jgi:hypothetical protein